MQEVYDIFSKIRAERSIIKKIEILKIHKSNKLLKQYFILAVDPSIKFYVKGIPVYTISETTTKSLQWAFDQLLVLLSRTKTGNAASLHLKYIFENITSENAILIRNIIKKDANCGIAFKGINKIWKNSIKKEPYQRFMKESDKAWSYIKYPCISTLKEDGEFGDIQIRGSMETSHVITRGSNTIDFHGYFDDILSKLFMLDDFVIMTEMLVWDENTGNFMNRQKGNGILNSNIPNNMLEHIHFKCINIVPWDNFIEGHDSSKYEDRLEMTKQIVELIDHPQFSVIEHVIVNNREEANNTHLKRRENGKEGTILYNTDLIWENTDSGTKGSMKQKQREKIDLEITDWKKHSKNDLFIGSLKCESSDGMITVWVGSMKEKYRVMDPNSFIGKIAVVEANDIVDKNESNKYSLFLAAFSSTESNLVRTDKTEADSFEDICNILKARRFLNKAKKITKKQKIVKQTIKETDVEDLIW